MLTLNDDSRAKLRKLINEHTGLHFKDYGLKDLEGAVLQRMAARRIISPLDYILLISLSDEKENEFRELLNLLTINHTYFFRNEPQFKVLKENILPEIIKKKIKNSLVEPLDKKVKPSIRIWSAGCSTGEEPYTIALVIKELIPDLENWDIQILATDASENALEKARHGVFSSNSVKGVPEHYLEKYFRKQNLGARSTQYEISDEVKQMVMFAYFNLIDKSYPCDFDIIFCRNVVIYFHPETVIDVMARMYESLRDDGYFLIGYSETLQFMQNKFKMFCVNDAIYYQKQNEKIATHGIALKKSVIPTEKALEEISLKQALAEIEAELKKIPTPPKIESLLVDALKFSRMKKYDRALLLISEAEQQDPRSTEPLYFGAEILLSQGKIQEAKTKLDKALRIDPFFAAAHYLLGCLSLDEGLTREAKESLKKVLYLDKNFFLAHFYLAQAYKLESMTDEAVREYRNTAKSLSHLGAEDIIPYSGGFNAATILSVCYDNIERLKLAIN